MYPSWPAFIPATFTMVSLILIILSIIAGYSPGMMEDYHVLYFNTSTLGKSLLDNKDLRARLAPAMPMVTEAPILPNRFHNAPSKRVDIGDVGDAVNGAVGDVTSIAGAGAAIATSVGGEAASAVKSAAAAVETGLEHLVDEAKDALEEIVNDLADELYKKLGIQQFYSIHLTDMCYGNFTPNATAKDAGFGVVNCTAPLNWTQALDLTGMLNQSLGVGPFQLDLGDIGMAQDVVDTIDKVMKTLNQCLEAILSFYILAALFTGLSAGLSIWNAFETPDENGQVSRRKKYFALYGNVLTAWTATLFLFIGNMITTLGGKYAVDDIHDKGRDFGLYAYRGSSFLATTWAAFALVLIAAAMWTIHCAIIRLAKSKGAKPGMASKEYYESSMRSD